MYEPRFFVLLMLLHFSQVFFPTTTTQLVKRVVVGIYKALTNNKSAKINTRQLRKIHPFHLSNHHQHSTSNRVVVGK